MAARPATGARRRRWLLCRPTWGIACAVERRDRLIEDAPRYPVDAPGRGDLRRMGAERRAIRRRRRRSRERELLRLRAHLRRRWRAARGRCGDRRRATGPMAARGNRLHAREWLSRHRDRAGIRQRRHAGQPLQGSEFDLHPLRRGSMTRSLASIDLNSDLGEGAGTDAELMPLISSANIACGAHAGDDSTMRETVALARRYGVAIGAHPGYPDRANFGRVPMPLTGDELSEEVARQIRALKRVDPDLKIGHVKAHGALYNQGERDSRVAKAIVAGVIEVFPLHSDVGLEAPPKSAVAGS